MKCDICNKDKTSLDRFDGKDVCGACKSMIEQARKPENPKKGDARQYVEK